MRWEQPSPYSMAITTEAISGSRLTPSSSRLLPSRCTHDQQHPDPLQDRKAIERVVPPSLLSYQGGLTERGQLHLNAVRDRAEVSRGIVTPQVMTFLPLTHGVAIHTFGRARPIDHPRMMERRSPDDR